jgi:hypothetical protein
MKTLYILILRIIVMALFITLPCLSASGQDVIMKKTGEEIKGKVTEILDADIKYVKEDNPTGPVYSVKKSEVLLIIFANGKKEIFNAPNSPVVSQPPKPQGINPAVTSGQIARARGGSILNYILIIPIFGLGTAAVAINEDVSKVLGGVATGIGAIGIPVASIIAGNPMRGAGVKGSPGLRIVGWISYGLFIMDAITLIAASDDLEDETITLAGVGTVALGVISTTFLGLDKSMKARQGKSRLGTASLQPTIGYIRNLNGDKNLTMGIRINF